MQTERESGDLPIGSRGGIAIRHHFPLDAEYVIKVRLQRGKDATTILGMSEPRQLDIRLDGGRIQLFTVGGQSRVEAANAQGELDDGLEVSIPVKAGPHLVASTFLKDTVKPEGVLDAAGNRAFFEGVGSVSIAGPYAATGSGRHPEPPEDFRVPPTSDREMKRRAPPKSSRRSLGVPIAARSTRMRFPR